MSVVQLRTLYRLWFFFITWIYKWDGKIFNLAEIQHDVLISKASPIIILKNYKKASKLIDYKIKATLQGTI